MEICVNGNCVMREGELFITSTTISVSVCDTVSDASGARGLQVFNDSQINKKLCRWNTTQAVWKYPALKVIWYAKE